MTSSSIVENPEPLQPNFVPATFVNRREEYSKIHSFLTASSSSSHQVLWLHGDRGTGKTHLTLSALNALETRIDTCYISCHKADSQYKVLKTILSKLSRQEISRGHHTASLQRKFQNLQLPELIIVLDELDFLLCNEGDDLLYFLSRTSTPKLKIICITSQVETSVLDERTASSLLPQHLHLEPYTSEEIFKILANRAAIAFRPKSLHHQALKQISESVDDTRAGLTWLKSAAQIAEQKITPRTVRQVRDDVLRERLHEVLNDFSLHHELLFQAISELVKESGQPVRTGEVYQRYQKVCVRMEEDALSDRRVSDYLEHLDLLGLIDSIYHYGGRKGKTREITPNFPVKGSLQLR